MERHILRHNVALIHDTKRSLMETRTVFKSKLRTFVKQHAVLKVRGCNISTGLTFDPDSLLTVTFSVKKTEVYIYLAVKMSKRQRTQNG